MDRRTITVSEAAQYLGISRGFAYRAISQGRLPHLRIGRRILVPTEALDHFLVRQWSCAAFAGATSVEETCGLGACGGGGKSGSAAT
jgi:excisionase family DNA binding protein